MSDPENNKAFAERVVELIVDRPDFRKALDQYLYERQTDLEPNGEGHEGLQSIRNFIDDIDKRDG